MKAKQAKPVGELRMSAEEFDRIMGKVLQVKPEDARTQTSSPKARKKRVAQKLATQPRGSK